MPDKRKHRGRHPEDDRLFSEGCGPALRRAVADYSWLLSQGYADKSALKLVGDRFQLAARQRMAVMRTACSDQARIARRSRQVGPADVAGASIGVDGYNVLITVESALAGGLVLVGRDGCYRDLASVHGTYRKVEETLPALKLIAAELIALGPARIDWYLDKPVSNSGRLKALLADVVESIAPTEANPPAWNIELVDSPDMRLRRYTGIVTTSDSAVLDACGKWINLASLTIDAHAPDSWMIRIA